MNFFTDFNLSIKSSIGITNLLTNITTKPGSHKGGWTRILKCQLAIAGYDNVKILDNSDSLTDFDCIIFDLGAEFSGSMNLFGGVTVNVFNRLKQLQSFSGKLYSFNHVLPDLTSLNARKENSSACKEFAETHAGFIADITKNLERTIRFRHVYKTDKLLIGDSHTAAVWAPDFMIERRDGRTLVGMVEHNTVKKFADKYNWIDTLMVHASSIDVRHHLCRLNTPEQTASELIVKLGEQLSATSKNIIMMNSMPIEDESRKLPKTGYYKGTPFYGSWDARNNLRQVINTTMENVAKTIPGSSVVSYPEYFFADNGKLKVSVMETPQSVHISPEHYRTNLDTGKVRW